MFKIVHYEARMVGKRAVHILLKCFLVAILLSDFRLFLRLIHFLLVSTYVVMQSTFLYTFLKQ